MKTAPGLSLLVVAALAGLASAAPPAAAATYIIGTSAQGSVAFSTGTAISKLCDSVAGLVVRARATGGSSTVVPQIGRGQIAFGLSNALETGQGYLGTGMFKGKPQKNIRVVAAIFPLMTGYAVANDSKIHGLKDAKGMRIPSEFTAQTTFIEITKTVLASAGLKPSDFTGIPTSNYIKGGEMLAQGKVDMALVAPNSGASRELDAELKNHGGLRFVSLGKDLADMRKVFAEAYPLALPPSKTIPGLDSGATIAAYPFYLISSTHVPEDVIYKIVKVLHDNKDKLSATFASFKAFDVKDMARPHSKVPFHAGAVKYYKEIGIWQNGKM
jgi:TRAP transporter TAXI family solute receptor